MYKPAYLNLLLNGELESRVKTLKEMLKNCVLCPHECGVNRLEGERGYCKTLDNCVVSGGEPHFGEEEELVGNYGSGTIFFSHCNLSCVFCQNYEISFCGEGRIISSRELSKMMLSLQRYGCHNINLVSPSHIVPQIVEAIFMAAKEGLNIPIVYNTNGYDLTGTLKLLDGIVDIYMPDIKFADDEKALKYLGVKNYYTITKKAVKEMYRQVNNLKTDDRNIAYKGLMIRHLVLPQNLADTEKIMKFIGDEISTDTYVNIMDQYYPAYTSHKYEELSRTISKEEYKIAVNSAKSAGLKRYKTSY
ncbi:radical SAM protein [Anaeromicrobium sediminis]|uniref:radical SAM protein n=1 Tax=Anaeromicrobium sediminis TaxID=1478221 RepID=UPI001FA84BC9|nr:radical SAM protein [Anaeromicrobium sediminis]